MKLNIKDKNKIINKAINLVNKYQEEGYHCSEAVIRSVVETLELNVSEDFIIAACGFRGGGGGIHDRCGIIEVGTMIISLLYGRKNTDEEKWRYSYLIRVLHKRFNDEFNSIYCRDILLPRKEKGIVPPCLDTYQRGAKLIIELLYDADDLLNNIPIEEKDK